MLETSVAPSRISIPGVNLLHPIGAGAQSVVWKGEKDGKLYAVKIMNGRDSVAIREASVLARMQSTQVARVHEVGEADGKAYIIMELIAGESLESRLTLKKQLAEDEALGLVATLAQALHEAHALGIVHRDIKPANIIGSGADVKLIDFGIVATAGQEHAHEVAGSLRYSAPEQLGIVNRAVDGRADLYSLGCVLFHCVTGRPPFTSADPGELVRQHTSEVAPRLRDLVSTTSAGLDTLCAELLAKDPDDRPSSAEAVVTRIAAFSRHTRTLGDTTQVRQFVGRERELDVLAAFASRPTRGAKFVFIQGPPGQGKSRLIETASSHIATEHVLLTAKANANDPRPLAVIQDLFDDLAHQLKAGRLDGAVTRIKEIMGEDADLLLRACPRLRDVFANEVKDSGRTMDPILAMALLLTTLARWKQLVLVIDDLQWVDADSTHVLTHLASAKKSNPQLLVFCTLRDEAEGLELAGELESKLPASNSLRIDLPPLSQEETGALIGKLLRTAGFPESFRAIVYQRARGNPMATTEFIRAALDEGVLRPFWGQWVLDESTLAHLSVAADVISLILRRMERLSPNVLHLLSAGAVHGHEFSVSEAAVVTNQKREVEYAVQVAENAGLIERTLDAERYRFVHDRVREALIERLSKEETTAIHDGWSATLQARRDRSDNTVYGIARHMLAGSYTSKDTATELVWEAGRTATQRGNHSAAFEFFDGAYRASGESAKVSLPIGFLCDYAEATARMDRSDEANRIFDLAIAQNPGPEHMVRTRLALAVSDHQGDSRRNFGLLMAAWEELAGPQPRAPLRKVGAALPRLLFGIKPRDYAQSPPKLERRSERERALFLIQYATVENAIAGIDTPTYMYAVAAMHASAQKLNTWYEVLLSECFVAFTLALLGKKDRARLMADRALEQCLNWQVSVPEAAAHVAYILVGAYNVLGDPKAADRAFKCFMVGEPYLPTLRSSFGICTSLIYTIYNGTPTPDRIEACQRGQARAKVAAGEGTGLWSGTNLLLQSFEQVMLAMKGNESALDTGKRIYAAIEQGKETWPLYWQFVQMSQMAILAEFGGTDAAKEMMQRFLAQPKVPAPNAESLGIQYVYLAYAYILAEEAAANPGGDLGALDAALANARKVTVLPVYRADNLVLSGARQAISGNFDKAEKILLRAERQALDIGAPKTLFEAKRWLARIAKKQGLEREAVFHAKGAILSAEEQGYSRRIMQVEKEFGIIRGGGRSEGTSISSTTGSNVRTKRQLEALLDVAQTAARSSDPKQQLVDSLDKMCELLAAERAFLFLVDEHGNLSQTVRRLAGRQPCLEENYSHTFVQKILSERTASLLTGTEEGEEVRSESIVAHNLRSIIAAPVMVQERLIGVVYLDSRLAKNVFRTADTEILHAMAGHLGVAIETNRTARLEIARRELEKDLEVTGVIQSMLLPRTNTMEHRDWRLLAFYRSAAQSGGDFWWVANTAGRSIVLVGDVTGHGAGAAMVTAAVAAAFRTAGPFYDYDLPEMLRQVNRLLLELTNGKYRMTMSAMEISHADWKCTLYSCAAPPTFIRNKNVWKVVSKPGVPLGDAAFVPIPTPVALDEGDAMVLLTDGFIEQTIAPGRDFGQRRIVEILRRSLNIDEACGPSSTLVQEFDKMRAANAQEDDLTFVALERYPARSARDKAD